MTTLTETKVRQNAILMALNHVESILQPFHTGQGKNDVINILPVNIERLAINSDLISNNFCSVRVTNKEFQPGKPKQVERKFILHGYEHIIVQTTSNRGAHRGPCYLGFEGYALKSCRKVKNNAQ